MNAEVRVGLKLIFSIVFTNHSSKHNPFNKSLDNSFSCSYFSVARDNKSWILSWDKIDIDISYHLVANKKIPCFVWYWGRWTVSRISGIRPLSLLVMLLIINNNIKTFFLLKTDNCGIVVDEELFTNSVSGLLLLLLLSLLLIYYYYNNNNYYYK